MFSFSKYSFRTKLMIAFVFCSVCMMVVGGTGFYGLKKTGETYSHIAQVNLPNSMILAEMAIALREMAISTSLVIGTHLGAAEAKEEREAFEAAVVNFEKAMKSYEEIPFIEGEEEKYALVQKAWQTYQKVGRRILELTGTGNPADEKLRDELGMTKFVEAKADLVKSVRQLRLDQTTEKDKWVALAQSESSRALQVSAVFVIVGTLLSMLWGFLMSRSLSNALNHIAEQLSAGATEVAAASGQLSSSSQSLSSAASEQAASLQQTSASLEQVSSMVNKTSDNAGTALTKSGASKTSANQGQGVVQEMLRRMDEINQSNVHIAQQIERSNTEISGIVKVIEEIGSKTKVINDIVFQTKLLSFNASVEAARAGEHGKGFAVVAEEVGNLAQMSGNAAKEISDLLDSSIQGVVNTVNETKSKVESLVSEGRHRVESGITVARQCGDAFGIIVENITSVAGMTEEISTATNEQAQGVQEITKAIRQLDQVTQQNASANEQVAAASEELSSQARSLKEAANQLVLLVNGAGAKAA